MNKLTFCYLHTLLASLMIEILLKSLLLYMYKRKPFFITWFFFSQGSFQSRYVCSILVNTRWSFTPEDTVPCLIYQKMKKSRNSVPRLTKGAPWFVPSAMELWVSRHNYVFIVFVNSLFYDNHYVDELCNLNIILVEKNYPNKCELYVPNI